MNIAVVGAGISGLGAALLLSDRHNVTVLEGAPRLGGHSHTVDVPGDHGEPVAIDTGFIVYNVASYPNLIGLLEHLGVTTAPTEMSFSVSLAGGAYEYTGDGLAGLFAQPANVLSPSHWRMVADILRFFRQASGLDAATIDPSLSLGQFLSRHGYSQAFVARHILPMGAAIWSTPSAQMLEFPAAAFIRFCANHGLLQVHGRPEWRTVVGGSRQYVERIRHRLKGNVALGDPVVDIRRQPDGVQISVASGKGPMSFDACVIACHADEALALLSDPSPHETRLLGSFGYAQNEAVLHTDANLMPKRRRAWTSWNYMGETLGADSPLSVTYWMNRLQPLPMRKDAFVTLNPWRAIEPEHVFARMSYAHPVFDRAAIEAQRELWSLQGVRSTWYAGSYFGYGFHEDGLQSGLAVAEDLGGVTRPWHVPAERQRDRVLSPLARDPARRIAPRLEAVS